MIIIIGCQRKGAMMTEEITLNSIYRKLLEIEYLLLKCQPYVASESSIDVAEYTFIDKSKWPSGPWSHEPDRVVWSDGDFTCLVDREERHGFLCAYVGVDDKHHLYGKDVSDVRLGKIEFCGSLVDYFDFDDGLQDLLSRHWFGFCFGNDSDLIPNNRIKPSDFAIYKDIEYVKSECQKLTVQLGAIK